MKSHFTNEGAKLGLSLETDLAFIFLSENMTSVGTTGKACDPRKLRLKQYNSGTSKWDWRLKGRQNMCPDGVT